VASVLQRSIVQNTGGCDRATDSVPDTGFELDASTFSGSIRSELPLTLSGDIRPRGARNAIMHATFGDGSAALTIRTFSGGIVITR
jgi:hypothetical protein